MFGVANSGQLFAVLHTTLLPLLPGSSTLVDLGSTKLWSLPSIPLRLRPAKQLIGTKPQSPHALPRYGAELLNAFDDRSVTLNASHLREILTPDTCKCLTLHAIQCQNYSVLHSLLQKGLCLLSKDSILSPACSCSGPEFGPGYALLNFHGLEYVTVDIIGQVVQSVNIRGDGEYDPLAKDQPLVVQDLIAGGLQFPVMKDFLDSIDLDDQWVLESLLLLLEKDYNCAILTEFVKRLSTNITKTRHFYRACFGCARDSVSPRKCLMIFIHMVVVPISLGLLGYEYN